MILQWPILIGWIASTTLFAQEPRESDYYVIEDYRTPFGALLEVGGIDFLEDGRMVVSTRRGQVWMVENPLADDIYDARFSLFAEGLHEGLGLKVFEGEIYVVQRGELSRLKDTDQDSVCDRIETVSDEWGVSGNYHEFAYGLPQDSEGRFYVSLNVSFFSPKWWHGKSPVPYRGWVLRIDQDGTTHPMAPGFRSPCGLGSNANGEIFVTDNQGDWMPACPVYHLVEGRFYGHPASLDWTDDYISKGLKASDTSPPDVERAKAALWLPYKWSRSAGNLIAENGGGALGPFQDQLLIAELTNGLLLRADLEKIEGEYQGAVMLLREKVGSAVRLCQASDGSLIVGRTARGWGGQSPQDGLGRLRSTGKSPMEILKVRIQPDGFLVHFTQALSVDCSPQVEDFSALSYDYNYWWEYGSPEKNNKELSIASVEVSDDRKSIALKIEGLMAGRVIRVVSSRIKGESGADLLHNEFNYTLNTLPGAGPSPDSVAKRVPAPRVRERWEEEWLMLTDGDYREDWAGIGWVAGDVRLADAKTTFEVAEGPEEDNSGDSFSKSRGIESHTLVQTKSEGGDWLSGRFPHGSIEFNAQFQLAEGAKSGVVFQGRYELPLTDAEEDADLDSFSCGGIAGSQGSPGHSPLLRTYRGEGRWHTLEAVFYAPRFNAEGELVSKARFSRVRIDDILCQENVILEGPTKGAPLGDISPLGPLMFRGDKGAAAFRHIRMKAIDLPADDEGFERVFNGLNLDGWKISNEGKWKVEDGMIVGTGGQSHLFSPRDDYEDLEFRAWVKINEIGNSGMYFRVAYGPGWPDGYECQVNSRYQDPVKSGSFYNHDLIKTSLVPPDTWFKQHIICRDIDEGVHVQILVNGVLVSDFVDKDRKRARGHIALQQHHDGSVVHYRDLEVRELK